MKSLLFLIALNATSLGSTVLTMVNPSINTTVTKFDEYYLYEYSVPGNLSGDIFMPKNLIDVEIYAYDNIYDLTTNRAATKIQPYEWKFKFINIAQSPDPFMFSFKSPNEPVLNYSVINHGYSLSTDTIYSPGLVGPQIDDIPEPSVLSLFLLLPMFIFKRKK